MPGYGYLFGFRKRRRTLALAAAIATALPSVGYDGGVASGQPSPPSDPVRTTAKPAAHWLIEDNRHFTGSIDIPVFAAAYNQGSLADNFGIDRVEFDYEGTIVTVEEYRWHTFQTEAGTRIYPCWVFAAQKALGIVGHAHVYATIYPKDTALQPRVIGPLAIHPQDDEYDGRLEHAPSAPEVAGSSYQSLLGAIQYGKAQGWENFLITGQEDGTFDIGDDASTDWDMPGWCDIRSAVPGFRIGKTSYTDDASAKIKPARLPIRLLGPNVTLDLRYVTEVDSFAEKFVCSGIAITTSDPNGFEETLRGGAPDQFGWRVDDKALFLECDVSELSNPFGAAKLARGNICANLTYDIFPGVDCAILNTVNTHRGGIWYQDNIAFNIEYTGAEATATVEKVGNVDATPAVYNLVAGATTHTFTTGATEAYYTGAQGDGYTVQDFIDWVNDPARTDWTATIDPTASPRIPGFRASALSIAGQKGRSFDPTDAKTAPLAIVWMPDRHGDGFELDAGINENRIGAFNRVIDAEAQLINCSNNPQTSPAEDAEVIDVYIFGNVMTAAQVSHDYYDAVAAACQFGRNNPDGQRISGLVVAHNTVIQRAVVRNDQQTVTADYTAFTHNIFTAFEWGGGQTLPGFVPTKMHLLAGASVPATGVDVVVGGTIADLFTDAAADDYSPAGALLTEGFAPALPSDRNRTDFPAIAAVGALAASATAYVPPPPSADPVADLIALMDDPGNLG
ncbi:MAG: hypothetical protein AAGE86_02315, partial [Pseudomonadota bacterium]